MDLESAYNNARHIKGNLGVLKSAAANHAHGEIVMNADDFAVAVNDLYQHAAAVEAELKNVISPPDDAG